MHLGYGSLFPAPLFVLLFSLARSRVLRLRVGMEEDEIDDLDDCSGLSSDEIIQRLKRKEGVAPRRQFAFDWAGGFVSPFRPSPASCSTIVRRTRRTTSSCISYLACTQLELI
mgnify:CR=1 FL=1